ncbi:MAG: division/cell wall cluster transcriptional repressor MraZ [Gammaproteobacteria bacterium]|nr:division/cell wall cluster transcriptional repressor MraZ [Gammaproteobacteria bacterium]NIR98310.1 division/cell wall cluster transcriptional repressor MraZ [Gammaproteobacteria bacterium]NIT64057.1 division/cell wall cluster transcriptional repressor MraZ [Gammaproteobacteria bacterium]NIV20988.1 division/cell wall cluster transcriptional repressor MraZ [Gammaproteobacteria bacterium]NIX10385.1 division/cell wall cluster transcriptional repressor MraZ [Gammaproteobacteria bacterium]
MFRGVTILSLDAKGRIAMPTRYREELAERCSGELVVTVDPDKCLLIYPYPDWQEIERKLVRLPSFNAQARGLQRLLVGHATECEIDGHGRILVPPPLRQFAELDKRAVLIGQGHRFELWEEQRWDQQRGQWLDRGGLDPAQLSADLETFSL